MLSREIREKLANFRTPFYLYDMELLRHTLERARKESARYGYKIHYALKANFDRRIFETVRQYGMGVDCVSGNEVRYSIESGFPANSIVYAGVGKRDDEIRYGIEQGIFAFNCESRHELEIINALAADMGKVTNVALRINPDVDPQTHKNISTGHGDSKFGISYKEIYEVAAMLPELKNVNVTGLHFHIGSQITTWEPFINLCKRVNTLYEWFTERGFKLSHINVGGGLGVNYKDPESQPIPDFKTYFSIFAEHLEIDPAIEIHFELGRSLVGQCGELISQVLFNKTTVGGNNVAIIDASMTELIRPALYDAHHAIENLSNNGNKTTYTIGGTVCESSDIFARGIELPELHRGDLISIKTAGAYGSAMASRYNMHDLPEAIYSDEIK